MSGLKAHFLLSMVVSFALGIGIGYLRGTGTSFLPKPAPVVEDRERIITFKSSRVPFSFMHPANFPVTPLQDRFIYQFDNRVEAINLGTLDNSPNAGGPGEGYIIVERYVVDSTTPEQRLLQENEARVNGLKSIFEDYTEPEPVITKTILGNGEAYQISATATRQTGGNLAPVAAKYYIEREGLRYIIGITPHDTERAIQMQAILQTLHFDY